MCRDGRPRLNSMFGNIPAHSAERLSVIALKNLEPIGTRAKEILRQNREVIDAFLNSRDDLRTVRPRYGTVVAPKILGTTVDSLCSLLRDKYQTSVVPGGYFEMPEHIRVGFGCDPRMLSAGLKRLGEALDELR